MKSQKRLKPQISNISFWWMCKSPPFMLELKSLAIKFLENSYSISQCIKYHNNLFPWLQIMVMYPPQPAEPVSAGFNEETGDPVEITVSSIYENNEHHISHKDSDVD